MTTQNTTGWVLIATAAALMLMNLSDSIADLKEWHAAAAPAFVAVIFKQLGSTVLAVLGGKMTKQFGGGSES